jgi:hypothetical protein
LELHARHFGKPLGSLRDRLGGWSFPRRWFDQISAEVAA